MHPYDTEAPEHSSHQRISVFGAGAWGMALSFALARASRVQNNVYSHGLYRHKIILYARNPAIAQSINEQRLNPKIPTAMIPAPIDATSNLKYALDSDIWFIAVPQQQVRILFQAMQTAAATNSTSPDAVKAANNNLRRRQLPIIVLCSKGIEQDTGKLPEEIANELYPDHPLAILAGPNFAHEIIDEQPSVTTVASRDYAIQKTVAAAISSSDFVIEMTDDTIGVQVCSALKNLVAIGAGMIAGAGYGSNTVAAYLTAAIREIALISEKMGGKSSSIMLNSGIGDILLTCTNKASRNYSFGYQLGQEARNNPSKKNNQRTGSNKSSTESATTTLTDRTTIEGYHSAQAIRAWQQRLHFVAPINTNLADLLANQHTSLADIRTFISTILGETSSNQE